MIEDCVCAPMHAGQQGLDSFTVTLFGKTFGVIINMCSLYMCQYDKPSGPGLYPLQQLMSSTAANAVGWL